jgi:hypothetical protein
MKQDNTQQFETIVRTLLSSQQVEPRIIREHIAKYAKDYGLSYDLARQAVTITANYRLQQKLAEL